MSAFPFGSIVAFTPAVGVTWPALLPIALGTGALMGYKLIEDPSKLPTFNRVTKQLMNTQIVQLDLAETLTERDKPINIEVIAEELQSDQILRFQRGKVIIVFKQDTRGKFGIDVLGPASMNRKKLRGLGLEFARRLIQGFAADRIARELEKTNAVVVGEEQTENEEIVLTVRRWV